jgi:aerobic carbon-monoxide dehydrogenase small subunit
LRLELTVNGRAWAGEVEPRLSLADLVRERMRLTGTHLGCEQGACGACTVLLDGEAVRSCLLLAVQASGRSVTTVEGVELDLGPVFQCGFCRPGFVVTAEALRRAGLPATEEVLAGNICRCTGYSPIVEAVRRCLT